MSVQQDVEITGLPEGNELANADVLPAVDVSDTSEAATGTTKKFSMFRLLQYIQTNITTAVTSVNGETGAVVLDADDIDDTATTNKFTTQAEINKLAGIEAGADVTDNANVLAAIGYTPENASNKSVDVATDSASNVKYPTVKAVYDWVLAQAYLTSSALTGYATEAWVTAQGYITSSALVGYATEAWVTAQGYITSSALVGYATEAWVTAQGYITNVITALGYTPEDVANKSTSTSLGASDTLYPSQNAVKSYVDTGLASKQNTLVNQTNIKSINGTSLLGSGDLTISGGGGGALSINTQTASYTLVLTDAAKLVRMNVASANDLTIPPNSSVAFDVGTVLYVEQMGAATTSIVAGSGVTINTTAVKTPYQYGTITLIQVSADVWNVIGGTV